MIVRIAKRFGLFSFMLVLLFAGQGCTTVHNIAATEPMPREGNVILVRGLMDVFSLGLNDIEENLIAQGVNAHVVSGPRWASVSNAIKLEHKYGKLEGPLVIVGHSYGADDAVRLARSLKEDGIEVDVLALIDPTTPPKIPSNVGYCFNLYKSSPATDWVPLLRGIPVEVESSSTQLVNYDIRDHNEDGRYDRNNHFNIEEDADVQQTIIEQVLRVCGPNSHYAGASSSASGPVSHVDGNGSGAAGADFAGAQPR